MARRSEPTTPQVAPNVRYARQHALADWGEAGQARLRDARVLVIGLGGLGAPVVTYLAGAGVGHLTLNDFDTVDASNLPRQSLFRERDLGRRKTAAARDFVQRRNSDIDVATIDARLGDDGLREAAAGHDVVVDACDNFGTRFAVNAACVISGTPLVSAAAIRYEGQLSVFDRRAPTAACYACLYAEEDAAEGDCQGQGVFTPLVGAVGSLAAGSALRLLLRDPEPADSTLVCIGADGDMRRVRIARDPHCRVCGAV